MKVFYTPRHVEHCPATFYMWGQFMDFAADTPGRIAGIREVLESDGHTVEDACSFGLRPVAAVHSPEYLAYLSSAWSDWQAEAAASRIPPDAARTKDVYPLAFPARRDKARYPSDVMGRSGYHAADMWMPIGEKTWDCALAAANLAVAAAETVMAGDKAAYALCRPYGHHAYGDRGGGHCYLNNAAIAAQHLLRKFRRVALIDIDVHHGNGAQEIFYNRDDVLTISLHCSTEALYPYFVGGADERGEGAGLGHNLNLPLPPLSGDGPYLKAFETALARIAAYQPDALVVALGVDAHEADTHQTLKISFEGFHEIAARLATLNLPTVLVQEGGYNPETIGRCVGTVLAGIEGRTLSEAL